jgi:hypothetical protein
MSQASNIDYDGFLRGLDELLQVPSNTFHGPVLRELSCWDSLAIVEFMAFAWRMSD